jgi:FAD/FMN-containing dehydrogenase
MAASFSTRSDMLHAVAQIAKMDNGPACIDMVDRSLLNLAMRINPSLYKGTFDGQSPESILIFEFDDESDRTQYRLAKKVRKILSKHGAVVYEPEGEESEKWLVLRDSSTLAITHTEGLKKAVPVIDDAMVPVDKLGMLMDGVDNLMATLSIEHYSMWGRAGDGVLHIAPVLDISQTGDRQKAFRLMEEYYKGVLELGGSVCGDYAEGRMRAAIVRKYSSEQMATIMKTIKNIFDPHGIVNPNVKVDVTDAQLKAMLRSSYSLSHQYTHLPRA